MGTEGEELDAFADDFEAENPDADVKVTAVPWEAAHDKIADAIAAGETPDVSLIGTTWMGEFAERRRPRPDAGRPDRRGRLLPGRLGVHGGGRHVVRRAWYVETRVLYYRTDLAEQAGWTEAPQTWDELSSSPAT